MDAKADLFDENPRPDPGHQLPVADDFTRVFDEDEQDVEGAAAELDRLIFSLEKTLRGRQPKGAERDDLMGMTAAFLKHCCEA